MDQLPRMLAGRYEIGRLIGRGGMAQVYIGYDTRLSRTVAIKVLRSDMATDDTFLARFRREAQSSAALNHPSIVGVYDTGDEDIATDSGTVTLPFIVMEYVKGRTVRDLLSSGDPIPIDEAAQITAGVLSALEYSHHEGIIHRDIKPGNIMLTPKGNVKVMDFGIARAIADATSQMTQTNTVVGTAQYLSPEQARGEVVDARSDLYSAGCLLYEMLTGRPPFTGDSALSVAYQHVSKAPQPASSIASDIPDSLDRVIMKALAKNKDDRYQSAEQFRSDLLAAIRGQGVSAPATAAYQVPAAAAATPLPPTTVVPGASAVSAATGSQPIYDTSQFEAQTKKSNGWLWALLVVLLLAVGFVGWQVWKSGQDDPDPTDTTTEVTTVTVPALDGMNESEARAALEAEGLTINIADPVESDEVEAGLFVSADPAPGTDVEQGSVVTVTFSSGVGEVEVPDVSSMTIEDARRVIEREGLEWGNQNSVDDQPDVAKDRVIDTSPSGGSKVERGTRIDINVSSGRSTVPYVAGMTQDEAITTLTEAGFGYRVEEMENGDVPPGNVISQNLPAGTTVDTGTEVTIRVAIEPEPTEDPTTDDPTTEDPTTEEPTSDEPSETDPTDDNQGGG